MAKRTRPKTTRTKRSVAKNRSDMIAETEAARTKLTAAAEKGQSVLTIKFTETDKGVCADVSGEYSVKMLAQGFSAIFSKSMENARDFRLAVETALKCNHESKGLPDGLGAILELFNMFGKPEAPKPRRFFGLFGGR